MDYPVIHKPKLQEIKVKPNIQDYAALRKSFSWEQVKKELDGLEGGGLNLAYEAIDRHVKKGRGNKVAFYWESAKGEEEVYTFAQFKTQSDKFANVLQGLGIQKGDRVFIFMDRLPELYFAFFGILKIGAIAGPLFSAFGPDPVRDRLKDSGAKVLVTQPDLRRRISGIIPELFDLQHILVANKNNRDPAPLDMADLSYEEEMRKASANFDTCFFPTVTYILRR